MRLFGKNWFVRRDKPCPFCGSRDIIYRLGRMRCQSCLAFGPWSHLRMEYAARDKWNGRK
jgi:hypothetical protein